MGQFVYVLEDRTTHLLKIGISVDPDFRRHQIDRAFGTDAALLGVLEVDNARRTERFIHVMLAPHRVVASGSRCRTRRKAICWRISRIPRHSAGDRQPRRSWLEPSTIPWPRNTPSRAARSCPTP